MLGATGSIGTQAADIIEKHPEMYRAEVVTGGRRVDELARVAVRLGARHAVIADASLLEPLRKALGGTRVSCSAGPEALVECVQLPEVDTVLTATVGYSGLAPTIAAIKAGKDIALANKETLVVAGDLITSLLDSNPQVRLFPVDSEHSAIAQCLAGEEPGRVERLIITASGGPFRTWEATRIAQATAADALKHPNWNMGAKITVDSASLMNKAFELIEARYLFGIEPARISAVIHPQSVVHSMIEFVDGAIKAQLGVPDMHLPIAYALGGNLRLPGAASRLSLAQMSELTFESVDAARFPCFGCAELVFSRGGNTACIINAANEIAVSAFLNNQIRFGSIYPLVEQTLQRATFVENPGYDDFVASNSEARAIAAEIAASMASAKI